MKKHCVAFLIMVFIAMLLASCSGGGGDSSSPSLSSEKAITAFSFTSPAATGTINENAKTITVTVPFGTNVKALVAAFTTTGANVKVGSTAQVSGTTPNDFTNPVSYIVTAADSSTAMYAVTVNIAANPANAQWAQTVTA